MFIFYLDKILSFIFVILCVYFGTLCYDLSVQNALLLEKVTFFEQASLQQMTFINKITIANIQTMTALNQKIVILADRQLDYHAYVIIAIGISIVLVLFFTDRCVLASCNKIIREVREYKMLHAGMTPSSSSGTGTGTGTGGAGGVGGGQVPPSGADSLNAAPPANVPDVAPPTNVSDIISSVNVPGVESLASIPNVDLSVNVPNIDPTANILNAILAARAGVPTPGNVAIPNTNIVVPNIPSLEVPALDLTSSDVASVWETITSGASSPALSNIGGLETAATEVAAQAAAVLSNLPTPPL